MANSRIDLHVHSTASDGSFTPRQLIEMAKRKCALDAVALTDHDTVAGVAEFQEAGREFNIETFTGVEVSADFTERTMHILGYGMNIQDSSLLRRLESIQEGRSIRNIRIIERLQSLGISITIDDVKGEAGTTCSQVGRPHIAGVLLKKGVVVNIRDAFDRYLKRGAPAYMERKRFSPEECVDMISQSGGVAALAHPKVLQFSHQAELESALRRLCAAGLGGIEVYYPSHQPSEVKFYEQIADKFGLIRTGGSDFHGASSPSVMIGSGNGSLNVPGRLLPPLRAAIAAARSDLLS